MKPYRQLKLKNGEIFREFTGDVNPEELVWHQDKNTRRVTIIEGQGWKLQLEEGLPFPLILGNTYEIPARTWHRVIKGQGPLKISIIENT